MNYLKIIESWSDEKWHKFGVSFLQQVGWEYDWNPEYDIFSHKNRRFVASFRHNIQQGSIGTNIEKDLLSRLKHANAEGFIGFYSGDYTTSLDLRLRSLNIPAELVSGTQISVLLPYFTSFFIDQNFGNRDESSQWAWNYYLNTSSAKYKPLYCMCGCKTDILENVRYIGSSAAFIHRKKDKLFFIYGLKECIFNKCEDNTSCGWVEINQILHPDQFNIWNGMLNEYVRDNPKIDLSNYYKEKRAFTTRIMQRMRSVNAGFFMFSNEDF